MIVGIYDDDETSLDFSASDSIAFSSAPTTRGPKGVAPDVYEGPDVAPTTGNYSLPGLDVLRADARAAAAAVVASAGKPGPLPSSSAAPSWRLPVAIAAAVAVGLIALKWGRL